MIFTTSHFIINKINMCYLFINTKKVVFRVHQRSSTFSFFFVLYGVHRPMAYLKTAWEFFPLVYMLSNHYYEVPFPKIWYFLKPYFMVFWPFLHFFIVFFVKITINLIHVQIHWALQLKLQLDSMQIGGDQPPSTTCQYLPKFMNLFGIFSISLNYQISCNLH